MCLSPWAGALSNFTSVEIHLICTVLRSSPWASWHGTKVLSMMLNLPAWLIMRSMAYQNEAGEGVPQRCHQMSLEIVQAGPGRGALCWRGWP